MEALIPSQAGNQFEEASIRQEWLIEKFLQDPRSIKPGGLSVNEIAGNTK
jgi:hypothetical protein